MTGFITLGITAFFLSLIGCRVAIALLKRWRVVDTPNARSNHAAPVPRGGGIVVVLVIAMLLVLQNSVITFPLALFTLFLGMVGFVDDLRGLAARWRFAAQLLAVGVIVGGVLYAMQPKVDSLVIPVMLAGVAAFAWLWFINLYNFMDGIDGITAVETLSICAGLWLAIGTPRPELMTIAGAVLGFAVWNRHPARLFLGDSGSVPLGFLLFGQFLQAMVTTSIQVALLLLLILPLYYWLDATSTLVWRMLKGHKPWQAHSDHAYQWAVRSGWSHAQVAGRILLLNLTLIALACVAVRFPAAAFACTITAFCATSALVLHFRRRHARGRQHAT